MEERGNIWICLSDLLAGLMAFFIFISAGIFMEYLSLEGIAFGEEVVIEKSQGKQRPNGAFKLPPLSSTKVTMHGDVVRFAHDYFASEAYDLTDAQKDELDPFIKAIEAEIGRNEIDVKILIVGHTSCSFDEEKNDPAKYTANWDQLSELVQDKMKYDVAFQYNSLLAERRAFSIFEHVMLSSAIIKNNGRENIRYIGMSERQAAAVQGDIKCQKRGFDEKSKTRTAEILLVEEWPKTSDYVLLQSEEKLSPRN
ncbi:MAG: hypothetical protein OCC46_10685 [Pseudodesulfovibrio sp.]